MDRQSSARETSKTGRESVMSTIEIPSGYVRRMVELESRGNGDQCNALDRVSRKIGIQSRAARRILNGERQEIGYGLFTRIRSAYLDLCESQARKLLDEVKADIAKYGEDDDLQNLAQEARRLREKVAAAKAKQGA